MSAFDLLGRHDATDLVAFGREGDRTATDLCADAGRLAAALPEADPGSHVLLVLDRDRYTMAVALVACLARGHALALPPNGTRDAILAVHARPETRLAIHDSEAGMVSRYADLLAKGTGSPPLSPPFRPGQGPFATVFTSGTTGPMQPWPKTAAELVGEAQTLARLFAIGPGDRITATVPPGHIYGLLFSVLLPLVSGAAFGRDTPLHAEAIAGRVREDAATVLVTVPVGLRACGALAPDAFPSLRRVFSSTGPLPATVAADFRARHGHPVTEILGSTETGGIATRQRLGAASEADERWSPMDGVRLSVAENGRLCVDSPFLHGDLARPFETEDLVQMHEDGRFTHLGRADGVVKIGGRRVAVQEVEECIRQHPGVEDAAVVAVPAEGGRGHQLLAAVSPADCSVPDLRTALRKRFEPTCLPRRVLCLDALPKEINGKVPRARLLRLFGLRRDGRPINWTLEWGEASSEAGRVEARVRLPEDYAWFDGHFEDYPVLAGAAQLKELLLPSVSRAYPDLGRLVRMQRLKFSQPIRPGDDLVIRLERASAAPRIRFEIDRRGDGVCSAGQLVFSADGETT